MLLQWKYGGAVVEKSYAYFDHEADVGIIGRGATIEAAFEAAAEATFAIMADLPSIQPAAKVDVTFDEPDPELALVTWLNCLLAEARAAGLALGRFSLRRHNTAWRGEAWGEPWRADLEKGVEVKGATLTMLSVHPADGGWETQCVVDV
ncbi:MAG: archease [Chloroflexi bacterium]|nr:archease [Chloroflexota bacterium]